LTAGGSRNGTPHTPETVGEALGFGGSSRRRVCTARLVVGPRKVRPLRPIDVPVTVAVASFEDPVNRLAYLLSSLLVVAGCGPVPEPVSPADVEANEPTAPSEPAPGPIPAYDRSTWHHWIDADHDCQDTRQEVLIEESEVPVTFKDTRQCRVATGRWTCPYTGRVFTDPGQLDIDHMVPLENAHSSGGWAWDSAKKEEYANDLDEPEHLIAVYKGANRSKGSRGPVEWMPPDHDAWCSYVADWIGIKGRWGLSMTAEERAGIHEVLAGCQ